MNKYILTTKQYELVREALLNLYYIYKDEGDDEKLEAITRLEEYLIEQDLEDEV